MGVAETAPPPVPTVFKVLAGTLVTLATTLARAEPVGPFADEVVVVGFEGLELALITMKATMTMMTARMLPPAMRMRRRCSARARAPPGRRTLRGDLLPAAAIDLGSACLAHARFVQPLPQPARGQAARRWFPVLRWRTGVVVVPVPGSMLGVQPHRRAHPRGPVRERSGKCRGADPHDSTEGP